MTIPRRTFLRTTMAATAAASLGPAAFRAALPSDPPMPDGFEAKPRPFGVSFAGQACSEPRLIELAYAFEQATLRRVPPPSTP